MLREILPVRQIPGEPRRRWFASIDLELITWHGDGDELVGFQLCYDRRDAEHALTWRAEGGFGHAAIDSGESDADANRTPILVPDGVCDAPRVRQSFVAASAAIDPELRDAVLARLATWAP